MSDGGRLIGNLIASQTWLETLSPPLQKAIREIFSGEAGRDVKNALHGVWLGHPLHPVLTDIPVGAWTAAMVLDGLGLEDGADAAIAIGLVGALGSAITGATDFSEIDPPARNVGLMHGLLNVAATALYATSLAMRRGGSRQKGIAVSMLGYAIAGFSAYLGGHLVYADQIGVDHAAGPEAGRLEKFTPAIDESELKEGKPARAIADGVSLVLVKRGARIYALSETCPHLGGPLAEGKLVGDAIECPWHGSQLALEDGHVVNGPTTFPAHCYETRIRGGRVEVRLAKR
jgi:nitrite reductase/ring-hydroxylating ferredoxin subunit/uncharacterized membrane protein